LQFGGCNVIGTLPLELGYLTSLIDLDFGTL
jgi:hypothetical protein